MFGTMAMLLVAVAAAALPPGSGSGHPTARDQQPRGPVAAIPDTAHAAIVEAPAPAIDGRIEAQWSAAPALPLETRDGPPLGHVRFAYDSAALYVAVAVPDDTLTFPERSWRFGDGFYLTVLMPGTGTASDQHISLGLSRVGGELEATVVNRSGRYFPRHSLEGVRIASVPDPAATPDLSAGANPWGRDVVYEVAIPWAVLAPADPLTIDSLAVNVIAVDRDGGSTRRFGMLFPDPAFDTERTPVRRGRLLPLRRRLTAPVSRLGVRVDVPVVRAGARLDATVAVRHADRPPGTGDPAGPTTVTLELLRGGEPLGTREVNLRGAGLDRAVASLAVPDVATGPITLRARLAGSRVWTDTLLLINDRELAAARERLTASVPDGSAAAAAVPTALLRLERIEAFAASAPANAPIEPAVEAWAAFRRLLEELASGSFDSLLTPGLHELAHRSGVDGTIQPYSVYLPDDLRAGSQRTLLVALHGSGVTEAGTIRSVGPLGADRGWIVLAPRGRGLSDWYTGAAETDVLEALAHARSLYPVDPERVVVAGFSMGGYGAWRLAARHAPQLRAAAILAGADCPPESVRGRCAEALLEHRPPDAPRPPLLVMHGARDNAVPVEAARRLVARLDALDWPHTYVEIPDAGHGAAGWWSRALDWLGNALTERGG